MMLRGNLEGYGPSIDRAQRILLLIAFAELEPLCRSQADAIGDYRWQLCRLGPHLSVAGRPNPSRQLPNSWHSTDAPL